jgi:hypothetical protein
VLKKTILFFAVGMVVQLYTTFVLVSLWGWFVTTAFHVPTISFWVMYGLVLFVGLFSDPTKTDFEVGLQLKALVLMVEACVPEEQRVDIKEKLEDLGSDMWYTAGSAIFGRIVSNTVALGFGFLITVLAGK